ncbi:hypothetical protein [Nocardia lasii]|uniref:Uncharacterized protein n=1 Tax=Nocardia lasii TaxID=1616107 RepID=A0ABW1JL11_9NOCA
MKRVLVGAAITAALLTSTTGLATAQPAAPQPIADSGSALWYGLMEALVWLGNGSSAPCTAPAGLC